VLTLAGCEGLPDWARPDPDHTPSEKAMARTSVAARPAWVTTHRDSRYPDQLFLTGVGEATSGFAEAEAQARTDLAKRIEVQIEGQDRFVAVEATDGGYRYSVKSEVSEGVHVKLSELAIVDRWQDFKGRRFAALAVLHREKAAVTVRNDLDALMDDAKTVQSKAKEMEEQEDPLRALVSYARLQELLGEIQILRRRYVVLRGDLPEARPLAGVPSVLATDQRIDDLLDSIRLLPVSGDGQRAILGRPLDRPLAVRTVSRMRGKETPLRDMPVLYGFERGQGQVDRLSRTDMSGQASAVVREVRSSDEGVLISAKLDVERLTAGMPGPLRLRVAEKLRQQTATFAVLPPRAFQPGTDPWMRAIGQLGETLLSRFDFDDKGKPSLAVLDFVETYGNQRLPLSLRLETGLRTALAQWDFVNLVQREAPATASRPEDKARAIGVEHYVDGVYALSKEAVTVNASLRRVTDGTTRAAGYVSIPREVLTPQDLQGFTDQATHTPGSVIAPTEGSLTYDQFLARLVMLHQTKPPFRLKLWTEKASYVVGEKVTFFVQAEQDCYLTLIDIGTSGNVTVLFPNAYDRNNRIAAGRRYEIPGAGYGFDIHVNGPPGVERLKAIATTQPFTLFENMDLSQGFFGLTRNRVETVQDFKVASKEIAATQWNDATFDLLVLDPGKAEPRGRGLVEKAKKQ
jgi:hypothetical protein